MEFRESDTGSETYSEDECMSEDGAADSYATKEDVISETKDFLCDDGALSDDVVESENVVDGARTNELKGGHEISDQVETITHNFDTNETSYPSNFSELNDSQSDFYNIDCGKRGSIVHENKSDIQTLGSKYCNFVIDSKKLKHSVKYDMKRTQLSDSEESSDDEYTAITENNSRKNQRYNLSSTLNDGIDTNDVYTNPKSSKEKCSSVPAVSKSSIDNIMKSSVLTTDIEQKHTLPSYHESIRAARKKRQLEKANSKGKNWFDMKAPEMTEEQKNDLQVLQMRNVLNPKAFYKHNDLKALPKFFQMGKVVEDATDFYCARIPKKQRKQNLVDELLADDQFKKFTKRKYGEAVQASGKHHRKLKIAKRLKKSERR